MEFEGRRHILNCLASWLGALLLLSTSNREGTGMSRPQRTDPAKRMSRTPPTSPRILPPVHSVRRRG
jgi:hypothetical protein